MKALSGYAEWFWLMAKNWKDVENRNWSLPHEIAMNLPQRIYLHASKKPATQEELIFISTLLTPTQWDVFVTVKWDSLRGHIIGETTITRQMRKFQYTEADHVDIGSQHREAMLLADDPCRSKWFFGKFGFVCEAGQLYDKPIPYKGQLGFFEVKEAGMNTITNAETAAALRHVLDAMSNRIDEWLRLDVPHMPWAEAEAVDRYLVMAKKALHEIIAEITKP